MHLKRRFFPLGVSVIWNYLDHREQRRQNFLNTNREGGGNLHVELGIIV